ncbi:similar to Saccharomyces cerevisiae YNL072W RNH201 Ribonuclease H2 catalytic subunit [Maudiozyma saulgeensis]|uniref:Ribonuclease n=1 Tax=Maudiozyma saulgeensis TaxID=1789683 RepID=A0A1X7QZ56_9SACH|nr:similar to Saccharomyces cerevisiae YNL072W RNH201 Ribonuclease H2 catalytic subunit [Kazachstania saulgeensis]
MTEMNQPPTVVASLDKLHTQSYFSPVPEAISDADSQKEEIIMGIDEAGRGPVIGPMVYAVAYCTRAYQDETLIPNYDFDDSKKLTDPVRRQLFKLMYDSKDIDAVGYATTCITPCDISSGMSRFPPTQQYNLNEQAHDTTMALIQGVLDQNVHLSHIYIDTVGPPHTYQLKLENRFPGIKFTVAKKADSLYCVVSVASVVAKVTRDLLVEHLEQNHPQNSTRMGSGYPSDPRTKTWLRDSQQPLFGWPTDIVRFSWQTCQTLLDKAADDGTGIQLEWEEDLVDKKNKAMLTWDYSNNSDNIATVQQADKLITLDSWYHA